MSDVILSAVVPDLAGTIKLKLEPTKSEIFSKARRVSARATLDGGSIVEDYGFSETDSPVTLVSLLTKDKLDSLNYIIKTFSSMIMSNIDGIFLCVIQESRVKGNEATIKIIIKERLT